MTFLKYPEYKDSGVEWLGKVPAHWESRRLKDGGRLIAGSAFPHESQEQNGLELPFYKVGDLVLSSDGRTMGSPQHTISKGEALALRARIVPTGAVVWAKIGAALMLNRRRLIKVPCCIDNNMTAYIPDVERLSPLWAYYWTNQLDFTQFSNPGAVPSLGEGYQKTLPLLLPPPQEQVTIAAFLDYETARIDALVEQQQRLIELLKEKRQAVISHAVTKGLDPNVPMKDSGVEWLGEVPAHWDVVALKRIVEFQRGHDLPVESREPGEVPVVSSGGYSGFHSTSMAKGPGIVTGRYGSIGKFVLVEEDYWPLNTSLYSTRLNGNGTKYTWYLLHSLSAHFVLNSLKSAVPGVDRNDIHVVMAARAPVEDQGLIVAHLDAVSQKIDNLVQEALGNISLLQERRSALISAAVTGKIDVRGWQPPVGSTASSEATETEVV